MLITYPTEIKKEVVRRYQGGESLKSPSKELNSSQSTLYRWRREFCTIETPQRSYTPKEFDAILRKLKKLEHEKEIIQLSGVLEKIPLKTKLVTLEKLYKAEENPYSVYELCEALDVARGTFYNHIFCRADNSRKMQELDLHSVRTDAKQQFRKRQQYRKQNLLERQFTAERPNQIWVSDITYFKVNGYWLYFCAILDLFSRKIVGWCVSRNASTNLVTAAFRKLLQKCGAKQSFSATARPHDNAVAEAFFATFKKE